VRFGIIGAGEVGALRARAIARIPAVTLAAVADRDPARASAVADRHGCTRYEDADALLADPAVEAVIVSTPPALHREHVLAALASGRPVLCEKPLAPTVEDCRPMVEEAERLGLALATGFNIRRFPAFDLAHRTLVEGRIGDLDFVRAYHGHQGGAEFTHESVHDVRSSGGGTLMDNGIHLLDLTRWFLGDVAEVKGYRRQSLWRFAGCEDNGFALLRNREGKVAMLQSSWTEWRGYGFFLEAYGTRGFVRASYPPMLFQIATSDHPGRRLRARRKWFPLFQVRERLLSYRWTMVESFRVEIEDFVAAVAARRPPDSSGRDGMLATALAHAIYQSSESGECVRLARSP
jgi:predicted dehydrogenase